MTEQEEIASITRVERTRRINQLAASKCAEQGVTAEELAIAALYTAYERACDHVGPGAPALEWLRTGVDVLKQQVLQESK